MIGGTWRFDDQRGEGRGCCGCSGDNGRSSSRGERKLTQGASVGTGVQCRGMLRVVHIVVLTMDDAGGARDIRWWWWWW